MNIDTPKIPKYIVEDGSIPSFEEFDKIVLNESGFDVESDKSKEIMEKSVADSDDKKLFTFSNKGEDELKQTFPLEEAVYKIVGDESFDKYWKTAILDNLDTERDKLLLEQIDDSFIGNEVYKELNSLSKLEVFYYIGFFQKILEKTKNDESKNLIDFDDKVFEEMPKVIRIF